MSPRFGYQAGNVPVSSLKPPPPSVCVPSAPPPPGWTCPGCGHSYAPWVPECHHCPVPEQPAFIAKDCDPGPIETGR